MYVTYFFVIEPFLMQTIINAVVTKRKPSPPILPFKIESFLRAKYFIINEGIGAMTSDEKNIKPNKFMQISISF